MYVNIKFATHARKEEHVSQHCYQSRRKFLQTFVATIIKSIIARIARPFVIFAELDSSDAWVCTFARVWRDKKHFDDARNKQCIGYCYSGSSGQDKCEQQCVNFFRTTRTSISNAHAKNKSSINNSFLCDYLLRWTCRKLRSLRKWDSIKKFILRRSYQSLVCSWSLR